MRRQFKTFIFYVFNCLLSARPEAKLRRKLERSNHMEIESLIHGTTQIVSSKIPVLGITIGAAATAKYTSKTKSALERALDAKRREPERIAASRAATIYGRRAIFKAGSTVVAQIPVYGTVAALAMDGADSVIRTVEGDPKKIERQPHIQQRPRKKSTEAFMQSMREQAAQENLNSQSQRQSIGRP